MPLTSAIFAAIYCRLRESLRLPRIGTGLIRYDANNTNARAILRWVDIVVDEGIQIFKEDLWQDVSEATLAQIVRQRLILRLPQQKEG